MISHDGPRIEHDSFGDIEVPAGALWGAQTERARRNFQLSGHTLPAEFIAALALIKAAAARANLGLGLLPSEIATAIVNAALAVARGRHDAQFPLDVYQTGSGTSTNMNVNEVIARLAGDALGKPVHPNDHVNMCQSSNDCIPSAIHVSAVLASRRDLLPALDELCGVLRQKEVAWAAVLKTGRTHLMDATPVTLGQEVSGWRAQI
ncbi:MAG TPA: lyase family protein, partial [Steroidobacteraceae bacterium]|nr:lyase family protein [Steroidobacteraceae bacterium]